MPTLTGKNGEEQPQETDGRTFTVMYGLYVKHLFDIWDLEGQKNDCASKRRDIVTIRFTYLCVSL